MSERAHASRRLKHELLSVVLVLALPAVLFLAFPYRAVGYRSPAADCASTPGAAFVELSESARAQALSALRFEWQSQVTSSSSLRSEIPLDLPEDDARVLVLPAEPSAPAMPAERVFPALLPPSLAAPAPEPLPAAEVVSPPVFSRESLLELERSVQN